MTTPGAPAQLRRAEWAALLTPALLVGFAATLWVRVSVGGVGVAGSAPAGLAFAAGLGALCAAAGLRVRWSLRALTLGVLGGLALCVPVVVTAHGVVGQHRPAGSFATWALVVSAVAVAEEAFLRGSLFDAVRARHGDSVAVVVGAVAFAALHVPLYGIGVVPLDLAVGLWFGGLRLAAGSVLVPAAAHVTADVVAWWLR